MVRFCRYFIAWLGISISLFFSLNSHAVLALEGGTFRINAGFMYPEKIDTINYKSGNLLELGFGLKSGTVRYELEVKGMTTDIDTPGGDLLFINGLYNVYYDFEGLGMNLVPYLAGGGGFAYVRSKIAVSTSADANEVKDNSYAVGFQIKGGLNYLTSESFSWNLGYTYFRTMNLKKVGNDNFQAHQISLGVIWYIG